jgi:hypothetical protein
MIVTIGSCLAFDDSVGVIVYDYPVSCCYLYVALSNTSRDSDDVYPTHCAIAPTKFVLWSPKFC